MALQLCQCRPAGQAGSRSQERATYVIGVKILVPTRHNVAVGIGRRRHRHRVLIGRRDGQAFAFCRVPSRRVPVHLVDICHVIMQVDLPTECRSSLLCCQDNDNSYKSGNEEATKDILERESYSRARANRKRTNDHRNITSQSSTNK